MLLEKIKKNVLDILNKRKKIKKKENLKTYYYLDNGHIDSFEAISFIIELEKKFNIKLTNKEIVSRNFRNVVGLISIIQKKIK